ncbi:beta-mannosidase [Oleiharenicola lentus]|nr:glycoside hydrolase family 2 protein [Oleiharenicola lentus]
MAAKAAWTTTELSAGWRIKSLAPGGEVPIALLTEAATGQGADWLSVNQMPRMVHEVLLDHKQIEAPWLPGKTAACAWVAERDWVYATRFTAPDPASPAYLRFDGLDTIVAIWLNGKKIAETQNMFVAHRLPLAGHLQKDNTLVLHFRSVFAPADGKLKPLSQYRGQPVRRSDQNYLNYLGPDQLLSRVGVFDRIALQTTEGSELSETIVAASVDETLQHGRLTVDVSGVTGARPTQVTTRLLDASGQTLDTQSTAITVDPEGNFTVQLLLSIAQPRLWWPRGYGDQPLYTVETALVVDGHDHQVVRKKVGFRRITQSSPLHFVVNNVPVRLWGGCWVTPDCHTAVWDPTRADRLFALAENAHFNAFRVWGVVEPPRDEFYELADTRGFLIWQDFPSLPLGPSPTNRAQSLADAEFMLKRLQHHPSILSWCGGNENALWHHPEYNGKLEDRGPWPGQATAEEVGELCRRLDPDRYFQPTSPYGGIDPNDPQQINTHGYTNLWYVPGYDYLNFASEDTRIAAPTLATVKRMMHPADVWPAGYSALFKPGTVYPFPQEWLKYTTSFSWKKTGPIEQYYDATDAASLVHRLGMAESQYYTETVERQRRGRAADDPTDRRRCGGYLVWKFNDSWPQIYSGKVDYFLEPYHAYYGLRRAFAPVMLSFEIGTYVWLWAVNDSPSPVSGTISIELFHLEQNRVRKTITRPVQLAPGRSQVVVRLDQAGIGSFRREHILSATLTTADGRELARTVALADIERNVAFPAATLEMRLLPDGSLELTTDKFARSIELSGDAGGDEFGWFFDDNYFDLLPGQTKIVRILGRHQSGKITARPWYSPHARTIDWRVP